MDQTSDLESIYEFLSKRGIDETTANNFRVNKMDSQAILQASTSDLKDLGLKAIGDIISLRSFCKSKQKLDDSIQSQDSSTDIEGRKKHLKAILEKGKNSRPINRKSQNTRKIYFGWIHKENSTSKQVRLKLGGGVREKNLRSDTPKHDLIETGKSLFFPNGQSHFGDAQDMEFSLSSFNCQDIGDTVKLPSGVEVPFTVQNYAVSGGFSRVKVYLKSVKKKNSATSTVIEQSCSSIVGSSQDDSIPLGSSDDVISLLSQDGSSPLGSSDDVISLLDSSQNGSSLLGYSQDVISLLGHIQDGSSLLDSSQDVISLMGSSEGDSSLVGSSQERKVLKQQQDQQFEDGLKADRQKEEQKKQEAIEVARVKTVKEKCALRTPPEPSDAHSGIIVKVQHLSEGLVERKFPEDLQMSAVYDWIRAMDSSPLYFSLRNFQNKVIPQKVSITCFKQETVYMTEKDPLVVLDESDKDITIHDYSLLVDNDSSSDSSSDNESDSAFDRLWKSTKDSSSQPGKRFRMMANAYELERTSNTSSSTSTATCTLSQSDTETLLEQVKVIEVHRNNILDDVLKCYEDEDVINCKLNVKFAGESGLDFGGLTTDLFTTFWDIAFQNYFEGDTVKVPFVTPIQQYQNKSVFQRLGRILYHGWLLTNEIPVRFNEASFVSLVHGEEAVDDYVLERSFLLYLSQFERDVLIQGLSTSNLARFQEDAIYGIYQQYSMNCLPATTPEELKKHIIVMARNHFVYKPMSIIHWMRSGIGDKITLMQSRLSKEGIQTLYNVLLPSKEKVLAKITYYEDLRPEESCVLQYLRNFIGSMDDNLLDRFLRFVTGSPAAPQKPIQIDFNAAIGEQRLPSSSTCSSTLHISTAYLTFAEFKREFTLVLSEDISFEMGVL